MLILILTKYRNINSAWLMLGQVDIFIDENAHLNENLSKDSLQKATSYIQNDQVALAKEGQSEYNNISLVEKERVIEALREVIKSKDTQLEDKQKIIDLLSQKLDPK
ncbi:MAG: hypothetical protein HQ543_02585 [Bacteroidetes bacterium]|nr:hypothetical protein [Bacteroidota bacterium]